jgi:hypothetical protein
LALLIQWASRPEDPLIWFYLDPDPLHDIGNTSRIAAVLKRDHLYDSAALTRLRNVKP